MKTIKRIAAAVTAAIFFAGAMPSAVYAESEKPPISIRTGGEGDDPDAPVDDGTPYLGTGAFSGGYTASAPRIVKGDACNITTYTYIPIENFNYDVTRDDFLGCNIFVVNGETNSFRFTTNSAWNTSTSIIGSFLCVTAVFGGMTYLGEGNTFNYTVCYTSRSQSVSTPISISIAECASEEEAPTVNASFALADSATCTVKAGGSATVSVNLKRINNGSFSSISASLSSSESAIIVEETGAKTSTSTVPNFNFRISSPMTATAGSYKLTLSTVVYGKDGSVISSDSYAIPVNVTSDVVSSGLSVSSYKFSKQTIRDGDSFTLKLTLENKCNVDLQDIKVSLDGLDGSKFVLDGGFSTQSVSIKSGASGSVTFKLVACSGIASVRESIPVHADYRLNPADASTAQSLSTSVIAECQPEGEKQEVGKYDITMIDYSFSSVVSAGTKFTFRFKLKNVSKNDIKDARVSVVDLNGSKFALDSGLSYANFSIKAGATREFTFTLIGCDGISSIRETISVEVSFGQQTSTVYATVPCVPKEDNKEPELGKYDISMTGYTVSSSAVQSGTKFSLDMTFMNSSANEIKDVRVSISELGSGKFAIDSGLSYANFDIGAGESRQVTFPLVGCGGIASIRETIPIEISFGQQTSTVYATVSCVPAKTPDAEDPSEVFAPAIIIENYDFGGEFVVGGTVFPLNITIKNTGSAATIENLKVTISGGAGNGNNGVAFSPANSSNSFFIERLGTKASEQILIDLLPRADANPDSYPVIVDFDYEYIVNGKRSKASPASETITIPLQQEDRFTINHPDYPETAGLGEQAYISASFVNKGKSDVYNVTADIEGEGFNKTTGAYYIGNVASGSEEYYDVQISPYEEGELNCELVVTYEDANGTQKEQRVPITMNVISFNYGYYDPSWDVDAGVDVGMDTGEEQGGNMTWLWFVIGGGIVLIVVIIIIVAVVKKKKKKKLESEDEDL